ncbi:hypothetical protein UFOVP1247_216 [uncultured Caudovirales phage]|uniref:Uncharacterized protein n=1 Tax=uncultured Caudovirales phage TaxID=2100421 RepID=A0A6J5RNP8_9CAUD|nr:hypothetical protein UFOVP970_256 [uncultured Caudovirales phage]CAB4193845.1 hypothetical protein UFOVP1247_216 [uncultured Caudovirales phage]
MKITLKNIGQFIEGNIKMLGDKMHLLSDHEKEQVAYRALICRDECIELGYCVYCGCDIPGKLYVKQSCNSGERFPDLMAKQEWEQFKQDNQINLE